MLLLNPYGQDYIKYLNDEAAFRMTYDQWKNKKSKQDSDKCLQCGNGKDHFQPCPKCNY